MEIIQAQHCTRIHLDASYQLYGVSRNWTRDISHTSSERTHYTIPPPTSYPLYVRLCFKKGYYYEVGCFYPSDEVNALTFEKDNVMLNDHYSSVNVLSESIIVKDNDLTKCPGTYMIHARVLSVFFQSTCATPAISFLCTPMIYMNKCVCQLYTRPRKRRTAWTSNWAPIIVAYGGKVLGAPSSE